MMEKILRQWTWIRIVRLLIGIGAAVQGIYQKEYVLLVAGGFIAISALLNAGCCGSAGCATNFGRECGDKSSLTKEIEYEEVDAGK